MSFVLRNGFVVDGTGAPGRAADVVVDGDRIAAVGDPGSLSAGEIVDIDGLILTPGFVDVHTHYDAQVLWDRDLTPSCWHGVTTVVMGNCGFGIAPTRPEHREKIARTLENVEGMTLEALTTGITWTFETFPEYLDALESAPVRLNVGALFGHTPLRLYVLGDDVERPATDAEIAEMRRLLAEALDAGALGFASSAASTHQGDGGRPVPSRFADPRQETFALVRVLGEKQRGVFQVTPGAGMFLGEFAELAPEIRRPITWTALMTGMSEKETALQTLERNPLGCDVWPQVACRPIVFQLTLADPMPFGQSPSFKEILALPRDRRASLYADPAWRERAKEELASRWTERWVKTEVQETEAHRGLIGRTLADLAVERGAHPVDVMIDLSLADDLTTRFKVRLVNDDEEMVAQLLRDDRTLLALSDAGAHASQLCDACYSTDLLSRWVRDKEVLTLERAIERLTSHPASIFRIPDRGVLRPGAFADLVAFDRDTVGVGDMERVWDLPAGADRLVAYSTGIEQVWVNGRPIRVDGKDIADARPGAVIRGGTA